MSKLVQVPKKTRDVVAEMVGMSGRQITKLFLIDKENEEMIDKGILRVNQDYIQTIRIKKEKESRLALKRIM